MPHPLEGKTLLVTGGTGFLGGHLVERLARVPGARLVLLCRRPDVRRSGDVTRVACDCRELTPAVWRGHGVAAVDYVFHLAAEIPKTAATPDRPEVHEANVTATAALLDSLPSAPRRFVLASTVDVYAPLGPGGVLREESEVAPRGYYGASKVECEELVAAAAAARGFVAVVLRYGHVYGPGEQAFRKIIPETIRRLLRGEAPVVYGDGTSERDYLFAGDAAEATVRAAAADPAPAGPVNVVRGESVTVRRVVETLARITGFSGEIQYLTDRPGGGSLRFDNRKMRAVLGAWPLVPLEEGLRREVVDFQTSGAGGGREQH